MLAKPQPPRIPLPKGRPGCVKSAVVHAIALAHYSIAPARSTSPCNKARQVLSCLPDLVFEQVVDELVDLDAFFFCLARQDAAHVVIGKR